MVSTTTSGYGGAMTIVSSDLTPAPRQRRNAPATKRRIVAAAQRLFATRGYAHTRLRDIAEAAGVAVSLLPQHFGSKADLFETALTEAMAVSRVLEVPDAELASALIEHGLTDEDDIRLPAMLILSIGEPDASDISGRVVRELVIPGLADRLGPPDAHERATEIVMITTGFLIYARQLPVGGVSATTRQSIVRKLQALVDGSADLRRTR